MTPKRRKLLLAVLACGLLAVITFLLLRDDPGPTYNGKTLRVWLRSFPVYPPFKTDQEMEARHAITQIGTNALPYLVKWIPATTRLAPTQRAASWVIARVPALSRIPRLSDWATGDAQRDTSMGILTAFKILGSNAAPAIPDLLKLASTTATNRNESRLFAIMSLSSIGPVALPTLVGIATTQDHPSRIQAIDLISYMGAPASNATPSLITCLNDENPFIVDITIEALGRIRVPSDQIIPALTNALQNSTGTLHLAISNAIQQITSASPQAK